MMLISLFPIEKHLTKQVCPEKARIEFGTQSTWDGATLFGGISLVIRVQYPTGCGGAWNSATSPCRHSCGGLRHLFSFPGTVQLRQELPATTSKGAEMLTNQQLGFPRYCNEASDAPAMRRHSLSIALLRMANGKCGVKYGVKYGVGLMG